MGLQRSACGARRACCGGAAALGARGKARLRELAWRFAFRGAEALGFQGKARLRELVWRFAFRGAAALGYGGKARLLRWGCSARLAGQRAPARARVDDVLEHHMPAASKVKLAFVSFIGHGGGLRTQ